MTGKNKKKEEIENELKETVIMRIDSLPSNLKLSIGDGKALTKEEMIKHVREGDETGKQIINSHLSFIRAIARGKFTKALASV